nr:MAG TPA: hypothetical protein [Bacteriophage sp.]
MTTNIIFGKSRTTLLEFPIQKKFDKMEEGRMKKTIDLLNAAVEMGFNREQALADIDTSLDAELEERQPLMDEEIPESLYDDILEGFRADKEMNA